MEECRIEACTLWSYAVEQYILYAHFKVMHYIIKAIFFWLEILPQLNILGMSVLGGDKSIMDLI